MAFKPPALINRAPCFHLLLVPFTSVCWGKGSFPDKAFAGWNSRAHSVSVISVFQCGTYLTWHRSRKKSRNGTCELKYKCTELCDISQEQRGRGEAVAPSVSPIMEGKILLLKHWGKGSGFGGEAEFSADPAHPRNRITRTPGWQESNSYSMAKILFPPETESSSSSGAALQWNQSSGPNFSLSLQRVSVEWGQLRPISVITAQPRWI